MNWLETFIEWYCGIGDFIVNIFFFVNPILLKLFALSMFVLLFTKLFDYQHQWIKYTIILLYSLYCIFKIAPLKDWIIYFDIVKTIAVLPFLIALLLPKIIQHTQLGKIFFCYQSMAIYYAIFNAIWLIISPVDGNLIIMLIYDLILYIIAQFGQWEGRE